MTSRSTRLQHRLGGISGVVFVVVFVASGFVGVSELSGVDQTGEAIARDLLEHRHDGLRASVLLLSLAAFFGFWFLGYIHYRVAARTRSPEAWTALAGGLGLVIAVMTLGVVLSAALAVDSLADDPETAKTLWLLEQGAWTMMTPSLAAFVLGISVGAIRTGDPSRWFGWLGVPVTVVLLANMWLGMGSPVVLGFMWVLALSIIMTIRAPATEQSP